MILTTGGAGGDPQFTEGGVGRDYLVSRGVPAEAIVVENEGESTVSTMLAVGEIMRRMGLQLGHPGQRRLSHLPRQANAGSTKG